MINPYALMALLALPRSKSRNPAQLPVGNVPHFTSEKPLSKRAKRRQRGKAQQ